MKVVITRPEPDASAFAEKCKAHGITPILSPLMEIEINRQPVDLSGVGLIAITSANGARAIAAASERRDLPVFAVGEASADAAREAGFTKAHAAEGDVSALAELITTNRQAFQGDVLHVAGTHRAGDLVGALSEQGVTARREVLYETRDAASLSPEAIAALASDEPRLWVSLFSPRSADLFLALAEKAGVATSLGNSRVACLSEAVAEKAQAAPWKSVEIAAGRNVAAMIELLFNA